jgi:hypothetical protein
MPNARYQTITAVGSYPVALDWRGTPPATSIQVAVTGGSGTYGLQWTLDDLNTTATPRWVNDNGIPPGTTAASAVSFQNFPAAWLQLVVTSAIGLTLEFKVLESTQHS